MSLKVKGQLRPTHCASLPPPKEPCFSLCQQHQARGCSPSRCPTPTIPHGALTTPLAPRTAPPEHPSPALPRGPPHLGSHSPSTWGPPRARDGISLSLATANTVPSQPASSLCLLLSPWRPQCHRGGSFAKATTITQHPPGPQLPPRGHHQHSRGDSDSISSPGQPPALAEMEQLLPACGLQLSACSPDKIPDARSDPVLILPRVSAPSSLPAHSRPLSRPFSTTESTPPPLREERRPCSPRPDPGSRPPPQPGTDAPSPMGCRQALLSLSGRRGAGTGLPPTRHSGPVPAPRKACHSACRLIGPVEGKLGRGR